MIAQGDLAALIRQALPDAHVEVYDRTGTLDHYDVFIRSKAFAGVPLLDRHRMVEQAVREARADGRLHALAIRTEVLE
ncbi:MAG: BolA/IbaG family iron-sulfur metabolism protein [Candidatus Eremiobacteraeota bacterium]|nr:BolA/IbaG family iron-sulfur metabolism protein [Candidatus Eremiobacteraeota bacterium]MBV9645942.1 BolA/IbaG family iron-sulfur metabolism protein [Candidatus Eremiobacteraeota bacterium]